MLFRSVRFMTSLTACGWSARGGRCITGLPLINWEGARDGSLGEGRVRSIHRHRRHSVGLHVWNNGGLSHRIVRGVATAHLGVPVVTHSGRRVTELSPIDALMQSSHREAGNGRIDSVEIHWSV